MTKRLLDKAAIAGDMLARGHHATSVQRLADLVDKVAAGDDHRRAGAAVQVMSAGLVTMPGALEHTVGVVTGQDVTGVRERLA